jgi:hypothetical protein
LPPPPKDLNLDVAWLACPPLAGVRRQRFGMERQSLKALLEKAEARMFEGAWRIARQKELIAEMASRGVDTRPYEELLARFNETQRLHIAHVQRIKRELYDPPRQR